MVYFQCFVDVHNGVFVWHQSFFFFFYTKTKLKYTYISNVREYKVLKSYKKQNKLKVKGKSRCQINGPYILHDIVNFEEWCIK